MGAKKHTVKRAKSLAAGRPPTAKPAVKSLTRKTTKRLINTHHQLEKRKQQALSRGDKTAVAAVEAEIEALGGLSKYQQASLQGQSRERGGDSSRVLMQWLGVDKANPEDTLAPVISSLNSAPLRMLEVGALSTGNACSSSGCFRMERVDLNSQGPGILQQDFLARPAPRSDADRFDIISLSLVLNYVPDHKDRGRMLLRCLEFLHEPGRVSTTDPSGSTAMSDKSDMDDGPSGPSDPSGLSRWFPSVFLVLPEPCVANSRYLTEEHLASIMAALGFDLLESKTSQRLVYYLWKRARPAPKVVPSFAKKELRSGPKRNNFSIVLQATVR